MHNKSMLINGVMAAAAVTLPFWSFALASLF